MQHVVLSGIRPSFPSLSRSAGQITHVLLTRSPLEHPASRAFPFDLHVLSTPPAFVLSQDQTLQTKTPGTNPAESNQRNLTNKTTPHPKHGASRAWQKNNNKNKTTKHTIEFSNNTRPTAQQAPRPLAAHSLCGRRESHRSGTSLWNFVALYGLAVSRRLDQVTREQSRSQTTCSTACFAIATSRNALDPGNIPLTAAQD